MTSNVGGSVAGAVGPTPPVAALTDIVRAEIGLARQLLTTIQDEHAALLQQNADAVNKLGLAKRDLSTALDATGSRRDRLLSEWGFKTGASGTAALLEQHPDHTLADAWQTLHAVATLCKQENSLVGIAIGKHLMVANQAIQVLKSGARPSEQLYAADGAKTTKTAPQTLAKI